MIKLTKILISHSLECKRNLKIVGDRKLEIIRTNFEFENEKEVCSYLRDLSRVLNIPKSKIDFYTIDYSGNGCIVK